MMREPAVTIINGKRGDDQDAPPSTSEIGDESACFMLRREQWELPVIARFTVDGEPVSKSRARFTKKGSKTQAYTPEKTHVAEQLVGWKFRAAARGHKLDPDATYGVMALFFCGTRQRRDVDNMLKLILDGLNGVAWPDDEQVTEVSARKSLVLPQDARTELMVYRVGYVQRFLAKCGQCGKDFATYPSWEHAERHKRFCSAECTAAWRIARRTRKCEQCGTEFLSHHATRDQQYCSRPCADMARRVVVTCGKCGTDFTKQRCHVRQQNYCSEECQVGQARERHAKNAAGTCETCGGPTSKKTYRQCRACRLGGLGVAGGPKEVA